MNIIKASYEILDFPSDAREIYRKIERAGRTCYKSEDKITDESSERFVRAMVKNHHEAMLEHAFLTVKFTVDRGVTHELVRHRIASFAQESSRYCNYSNDKFGNKITFIEPCIINEKPGPDWLETYISNWMDAMKACERSYMNMVNASVPAEWARAVLPNSTKADLVVTASIREWRHILYLRAAGITGKPHPQMSEIMVKLLSELKEKLPALFFDIQVPEE